MLAVDSTQYPAGITWVQYCQIATCATWRLWNDFLKSKCCFILRAGTKHRKRKGFKNQRLYTSFLSKSSLSTECLTYPSWASGGTDWSQSSESGVLGNSIFISLTTSFSNLPMCTLEVTVLLVTLRPCCTWDTPPELQWAILRGNAVSECDHQEGWQQQWTVVRYFHTYLSLFLFFPLP